MSERSNTPGGPGRARSRGLRTWGIYLLVLTAWAAAVAVGLLVGVVVCAAIPWQPGPVYTFLNGVKDYLPFVVIACVLGGWVVISYFFVARPARDAALLLAGAEGLARPGEEPIVLPPSLKEAEDQLNLVRVEALRLQRAARDAEQRKNDLVVYLAHDLKTPLTSVIGYLTLLRDEPDLSPAARARYTGVALDKAERLEDLINEFFDITRFNLSHIELERRPVDLTRMLQQVVSEFGPMLGQAELTCRLKLPQRLDYRCDPDKLARVFDNLMRNACHYATPGTEVLVAGEETAAGVTLTFQNEGADIPPEKLSRLFEQFFRLDTARATRTGGAGLGLAIAREIVELHGGTVTARSGDGRVTFTLHLPPPQENRKEFAGES